MRKLFPAPLRRVVLGLLLAATPGCATWVAREGAPAAVIGEREGRYSRLRLVLADGSGVVLRSPVVAADSVRGMRVEPGQPDRWTVVALGDVREVQTIRANAGRSALLVMGTAAALAGGLLLLLGQSVN